jgi:hypothetical protein
MIIAKHYVRLIRVLTGSYAFLRALRASAVK